MNNTDKVKIADNQGNKMSEESIKYWKGLVLKHKSRIGINRRLTKIARMIDDLKREQDDLVVAKRYITQVLGPTA